MFKDSKRRYTRAAPLTTVLDAIWAYPSAFEVTGTTWMSGYNLGARDVVRFSTSKRRESRRFECQR
jgi:hypothetical protein